jgi:hypothetical protein
MPEQCQLIEACGQFRLWENGLCKMLSEAGISVSLNHEDHEPDGEPNIGVFSN